MSMIYCMECGKQISDMAESCPYCGMTMYNIQPPPIQQPQSRQSAKKPISFGKPAITFVICMVLEFIFKFVGEDIGGIVGANIFGLAGLISWVRYGAFILLIVRLVEYGFRKLRK